MDFAKVRRGELIAGACGVLLLIDTFLPWYGVGGQLGEFASRAGVDTNVTAWEAFDFTDILVFLAALAGISLALLAASGRPVSLAVSPAIIVTALAGFVTLLVLYRIINQPGPNDLVDVKYGAYLGFLLCGGIAAGGFLSISEEGTSVGALARGVQGEGTAPESAPPVAPQPTSPSPPSPPPGRPEAPDESDVPPSQPPPGT